ncbi:MAG TPA: sulfotransferase [Methylomirabilota bacterium]|nr:sulfotransferase [Methylomirabilota bacterium]
MTRPESLRLVRHDPPTAPAPGDSAPAAPSVGTVLYIAGYGRSGSTALSIVLGTHRDMAAVGELTHLLDDWSAPNRACACGRAYPACPFWGDLFASPPGPSLSDTIRRIDSSRLPAVLRTAPGSASDRRAYRDVQRAILAHVRARTGKAIVVDSSKSARRAAGRVWALTRLAGEDVYLLHLVRSGLATVESLVRTGDNWALEGHTPLGRLTASRVALGWLRTNLWVSLLGRLVGPERYRRMRYEDFLADPATSLRTIGAFLRVDVEELVTRVQRADEFVVSHVVGGNRLRMQRAVRLWHPAAAAAPGSAPALLERDRRRFLALAGWLEHRYGYRGGTGAAPAGRAPAGPSES